MRGEQINHDKDGLIEAQAAEIDRLTAERDAALAQVAAWSTYAVHHGNCTMTSWDDAMTTCSCGLFQLMRNLPAAAARFLVAEKVARLTDQAYDYITDACYTSQEWRDALDEWRKAAGQ